MPNVTNWSNSTPSKSTLGSYVRDAKEMEFSLYTLQRIREELNGKIKAEKQNYPSKSIQYPHMETELRPVKTLIPYRTATAEEEKNAVTKNRRENELDYWGQDQYLNGFSFREGCLGGLLAWAGILPSWGIAALIYGAGDEPGQQIVASLIAIGGTITSIIVASKKTRKKKENHNAAVDDKVIAQYRKEIQDYNDEVKRKNDAEERRYMAACAQAETENPKIRERNAQRQKEYENACKRKDAPHDRKIALMQSQLNDLNNAISRMKQQRDKFYGANLIPVDYRTLDCVYILDHIFRNDLADTMREAIANYEERVYRGEVVRGINAIVSRLDHLTGLMSDLGRQLGRLQTEVSMMSNDVYSMAERQSHTQDQILEETRLRRYATEELNKNAEKIVKYCDTGRTY